MVAQELRAELEKARGERRPVDFAHGLPAPGFPIATAVKTAYIYKMGSRLANVRLDEQRIRKARKLRIQR